MTITYKKDLINLQNEAELCNFGEFIYNTSKNIKNRLWIASPFINDKNSFESFFNIHKIKNKNCNLRLIIKLDNINRQNNDIVDFFIQNGEVRTYSNLHAKMYIIDDIPIISSANLTHNGFRNNYELSVAGASSDIELYEQMYNVLWNVSDEVNLHLLQEQVDKNNNIDNQGFKPNINKRGKSDFDVFEPPKYIESCDYSQFLDAYKDFASKYKKFRLFPDVNIKYEIDCFLNFLFNHSEGQPARDYYHGRLVNKTFNDKMLKVHLQEFKNWKEQNTKAEEQINEKIRAENVAKQLFIEKNINKVSLEEIVNFLCEHINVYKSNAHRFKYKENFLRNKLSDVIQYIKELKMANPNIIDKLCKQGKHPICFGKSTTQEFVAFIRKELPMRNGNTNAGFRYMGYDV